VWRLLLEPSERICTRFWVYFSLPKFLFPTYCRKEFDERGRQRHTEITLDSRMDGCNLYIHLISYVVLTSILNKHLFCLRQGTPHENTYDEQDFVVCTQSLALYLYILALQTRAWEVSSLQVSGIAAAARWLLPSPFSNKSSRHCGRASPCVWNGPSLQQSTLTRVAHEGDSRASAHQHPCR